MRASARKYWFSLSAMLLIAVPQLAFARETPAPFSGNLIAGQNMGWVTMREGPAKYRSKTFKLPTATIRVLEFKKSDGGVSFKLGAENEVYVLSGTAEIGTTTLAAGDAFNLPTGTITSPPNDVQDTTLIIYTAPNTSKAPVGGPVFSKDAKLTSLPPAPAKDGVPGATVSIKTYGFDGNSIRFITLKGPGATPVTAHEQDSILYLVSGTMKLTMSGATKLVKAGDAVREPAGVPAFWEVLEDSTFVSTSGPSVK
jgi:quercetin dioxygenase-like cupin family protein